MFCEEELIKVEKNAREVAEEEDKDDTDEDAGQVHLPTRAVPRPDMAVPEAGFLKCTKIMTVPRRPDLKIVQKHDCT